MTRVLGGAATLIYDVSSESNWRMAGGAAKPVYIVGTGDILGTIIPPSFDTPPLDSILVSNRNWLSSSNTDYIIYN